MKLYNTLSRSKEEFNLPARRPVSLYSCGPTVYDVAHIGNLRNYIFNDSLKRTLRAAGFSVKQVMNVTDVDDKTIKKSGGDKDKLSELTRNYEKTFFDNLAELNIEEPDVVTRATEYIDQMVDFISDLLEKDFAYKGEDGSVYFSIHKFKSYGRLSRLEKREVKAGARVSQDEYSKENSADFVLWKAWDEQDGQIYWQTKLGKGRPGWHIECSAMSSAIFGSTIDLHTGGVDLIFPHHENEIAQSEARNGEPFVRFWVHGEHLLVNSQKMSKSLGNFYTLADIKNKGFSPLDFRYLVLGAHYRTKLNFTWEGLESARNSRRRLARLLEDKSGEGRINQDYLNQFKERVFDDLDIPGGLAVLWQMMRDEKLDSAERYITVLKMDKVLGLDLGRENEPVAPDQVVGLAKERVAARSRNDYRKADKLRVEIEKYGWQIEDLAESYKLVKKS